MWLCPNADPVSKAVIYAIHHLCDPFALLESIECELSNLSATTLDDISFGLRAQHTVGVDFVSSTTLLASTCFLARPLWLATIRLVSTFALLASRSIPLLGYSFVLVVVAINFKVHISKAADFVLWRRRRNSSVALRVTRCGARRMYTTRGITVH